MEQVKHIDDVYPLVDPYSLERGELYWVKLKGVPWRQCGGDLASVMAGSVDLLEIRRVWRPEDLEQNTGVSLPTVGSET